MTLEKPKGRRPHRIFSRFAKCRATGKFRCGTQREAEVVAAKQGRDWLRPYRCTFCGDWHLSSQDKDAQLDLLTLEAFRHGHKRKREES